jgi:porin
LACGKHWRRRLALALSGLVCGAAAQSAGAQDTAALRLSGAYTTEGWRNLSGGLRRGSAYVDNLDLAAQADFKGSAGQPAATIRISGFLHDTKSLSTRIVGDLQSVSGLDAEPGARLYEAWAQLDFAAGALKAGRIDLNTEFSSVPSAGLFINGAQGTGLDISQIADNGASLFPDTDLGVIGTASLPNRWTFKLGGFDGRPHDLAPPPNTTPEIEDADGVFLIVEGSRQTASGVRYAFGAWRHTGRFARLLGPKRYGRAGGAYSFVGGPVAQWGERRLEAFARLGLADPRTQQVSAHFTAGAVLTQPFLGAPGEAVGLAIAVAENSADFRHAERLNGSPVRQREANLELTYRVTPTPWLRLQPDVQYVIHPGAIGERRNALIVGLRAVLSWTAD